MATEYFGFPLIAGSQAQKHVTHNAALDRLDAILPGVAISATAAAPVGTPAEGDVYIIPAGGAFGTAPAGSLAVLSGGVWTAIPSTFGHRVLVLDEGREWINGGSLGWVPGQVIGTQGGTLGLRCLDFEVDLSVGGSAVTVADAIPARVVVLGVTSWTIADVTGPAAYRVGDPGTSDRFGAALDVAAGSSNVGVVGPFAVYSPTDLVVAADDLSTAFAAGVVGLSALIVEPGPAPI